MLTNLFTQLTFIDPHPRGLGYSGDKADNDLSSWTLKLRERDWDIEIYNKKMMVAQSSPGKGGGNTGNWGNAGEEEGEAQDNVLVSGMMNGTTVHGNKEDKSTMTLKGENVSRLNTTWFRDL